MPSTWVPNRHILARLPLGFTFALGLSARGHLSKTTVIDDFCKTVRGEFVETVPRYFSGPDPWIEVISPGFNGPEFYSKPDQSPDVALASVYSEGSRVVWLVLAIAGPSNVWSETMQYFFDESGLIRKRERLYQQADANVLISETTYFSKGRILKASYHHGPLRRGRENLDRLYDPHAPDYTSTADLPVPFLTGESKQLSSLYR